MRKYSILLAAVMLLIPFFVRAQHRQRPNDPVRYDLLYCPRLDGSHPVVFDMEVKREDINSKQELHQELSRMFSLRGIEGQTLHFSGELIHTIEITDAMLENAIQDGFRRSGIRNRGELSDLLKVADQIPPEIWDRMVDNAVSSGIDIASAFTKKYSIPITVGKNALRGGLVAFSDAKYDDHFNALGIASDAVGAAATTVSLVFEGTLAATIAEAVGVFLVATGVGLAGISMYDTYQEVTGLRRDVAEALRKIGLFYLYANEYLIKQVKGSQYANKIWKVWVKGSNQITGSFRNEPALVTWSLDGIIDKEVPVLSRPTNESPFSFNGSYFGWLTSTVHMDMSSYDTYYIPTPVDSDGYMDPNATLEETMTARRGILMSDGVRQRANQAQYIHTKQDGKFTHQQTKPTKGLLQQKLPVLITITDDWTKDYFYGSILRGETLVDGTYPNITTTENSFSIGHAFEASTPIEIGNKTFSWFEKGHEISTAGGTVEVYYENNLSPDEPVKGEESAEWMLPVRPSNVGILIDMQANVIERK